MNPILSILTPSVPSRFMGFTDHCSDAPGPLPKLMDEIGRQIYEGGFTGRVEHLVFTDNKARPVGAKRQGLLDMARGDYVAFVDDDDDISRGYLEEIIPRCVSGPDVVTFAQCAIIEGVSGEIIFDATCRQDEPWKAGGSARRRPWHVCVWRRELAIQGVFTEVNYGEDAAWVDQVAPLARNHLHIPRVLHYYRHSSATTEAPPNG